MSTILREHRIETLHDQVVSEVAQRWAKAFQCRVTIKTGLDHQPWTDAPQESDILGWNFSPNGKDILWAAEVETDESLSDPDTYRTWQRAATLGIPHYLLIPRGTRARAEKMAVLADLRFSSIYEYSFVNGAVQVQ